MMTLIEEVQRLQELAGINEGTWAMPQNQEERRQIAHCVDQLKKVERQLYNILGDDKLFDHLDGAIDRIGELLTYKP